MTRSLLNSNNRARLLLGAGVLAIALGTNALGQTVGPSLGSGGGGSAVPGGSNTQLQYNNAGAFGGVVGAISNGTTVQYTDGDLLLENAAVTGGSALHAPPATTGHSDFTLPPGVASDTLVGNAATQTLSNKTFVAPALGTPLSGLLTNATGLPISGITGFGANVATLLGGASSGTGGPLGKTSPTLGGTVTGPDAATWTSSGLFGIVAGRFGTSSAIIAGTETMSVLAANTFAIGAENNSATLSTIGIWNANSGGSGPLAAFYEGGSGGTLVGQISAVGIVDFSISTPAGNLVLPSLASDATLTDRSVCQVTATSAIKFGSGTLGICLGTSSKRFKTGIAPLTQGLLEILRLEPKSFFLDAAHGDPKKQMYGFIAEDMVKVLPKLVGFDNKGRPTTADYLGVVPVIVNAIHQITYLAIFLLFWNLCLTVLILRRRKG